MKTTYKKYSLLFSIIIGLWFTPDFSYGKIDCKQYDLVKVGDIKFEGLKKTKEFVVTRELIHKSGKAFYCDSWIKEQKNLEGLDVFSSINLSFIKNEGRLNLTYSFEELPSYIPFVGGKKTDQDGLIVGPAFISMNLDQRQL